MCIFKKKKFKQSKILFSPKIFVRNVYLYSIKVCDNLVWSVKNPMLLHKKKLI